MKPFRYDLSLTEVGTEIDTRELERFAAYFGK